MFRLFVDANVLIRCVVGRAGFDVDGALARGVTLATTDAQQREAEQVLEARFGLTRGEALEQVGGVVSAMEVFTGPTYRSQQAAAQARIHYKNTRDWPLLAAAIVEDAGIWTDDRDFFGVGVPVWTTRNVRYAQG